MQLYQIIKTARDAIALTARNAGGPYACDCGASFLSTPRRVRTLYCYGSKTKSQPWTVRSDGTLRYSEFCLLCLRISVGGMSVTIVTPVSRASWERCGSQNLRDLDGSVSRWVHVKRRVIIGLALTDWKKKKWRKNCRFRFVFFFFLLPNIVGRASDILDEKGFETRQTPPRVGSNNYRRPLGRGREKTKSAIPLRLTLPIISRHSVAFAENRAWVRMFLWLFKLASYPRRDGAGNDNRDFTVFSPKMKFVM